MAFERDQVAYGERHFELAYLANVLMAGCPIQARPFTAVRSVDPNAFDFIGGPDQLRLIRSFMRALPAILSVNK